ncbi:MAG: hypothetical protein M1275_03230 [Patescibacteria group bacterium]|nr:hypothetical protein [Patescibacteria group bacterium]
MDETKHFTDEIGFGARPDPEDPRDFQAAPYRAMAAPVDWSKGSGIPRPSAEDQNGSSSCVAQAWCYLFDWLRKINSTRRDLYARIFIPPAGGAYGRNGGLKLVDEGITTRDEVLDPSPETESAMRVTTGTPQQRQSDKALSIFSVGVSPDEFAQAIRDFGGVVFGVVGNWDDWRNSENPNPPTIAKWYHYIRGFEFHIHDGQKCIIATSSWKNLWNADGTPNPSSEHHIKENYFNSSSYDPESKQTVKNVYSPWAIIARQENTTMEVFQVKGEQTLVVKNLEGKYFEIATKPELYPYVAAVFGFTGQAFAQVDRATVNANLGGQAVATIAFVPKI